MGAKKGIGVVIVVLVLVLSVSFISAGFLSDFFSPGEENPDMQGELAQSAVAKLRIQDNSPPIVVFVSQISPVTLNNKQINDGNISIAFSFLAQQGIGVSGNLGLAGSSSRAYFNLTGATTRTNLSCQKMSEVDCGAGTPCAGTSAMNYSCRIIMRYYDNAGTWSINATVVDTITSFSGSNVTKTFSVNPLSVASIPTDYLNWTNPVLTLSTINRYSDNNVTVSNDGNQNYPTANINATYLNGTIRADESIPPAKFTVNNAASSGSTCSGSSLVLNSDVNVPGFGVPKATNDLGSFMNFTVCLTNLAGLDLSNQEYNASRLWELDVV